MRTLRSYPLRPGRRAVSRRRWLRRGMRIRSWITGGRKGRCDSCSSRRWGTMGRSGGYGRRFSMGCSLLRRCGRWRGRGSKRVSLTLNYKLFLMMKNYLFALLLTLSLTDLVKAQEKTEGSRQLMQITTIESVIGGGGGRSRMIITNPDSTQEDRELENLFSLTGINFKNIKSNEVKITQTLKSYTDKGWKLEQVVPLSVSPNGGSIGI